MDELSFKSMGIVNYPVMNLQGNFVQDCDIRFVVSVEAGVADAEEYQKAEEGRDPGQYLKENMPRLMKEAMHTTWESAIPLGAFTGYLKPMQEEICKKIETELSGFGLKFRSFSILALAIKSEHEEALRAHGSPLSTEELEKIRINMIVDEPFRPEKIAVAPDFMPLRQVFPVPAARKVEPWDCGECGMKNNTSLFCPQCGSPCKEAKLWNCAKCGTKNLTGKFCPECGAPRTDC